MRLIFRLFRRLVQECNTIFSNVYTRVLLVGNGVQWGKCHHYVGTPFIMVHHTAKAIIGDGFRCNSGNANPIGRNTRSYFFVGPKAHLRIGDDVGISNSAIVCQLGVSIGDRVKIGGNVVIYDTDFHALNASHRAQPGVDIAHANKLPVVIEDDVFIGAHSTILKGVRIGKGAIVGACSVVTKNIPAGEIWAGNPAKYIKQIKQPIFSKQ